MPCPHPLDPLCIAMLLRIAEQPLTVHELALELEIEPELAVERAKRLLAMEAFRQDEADGLLRVCPDVFRIVLDRSRQHNGHASVMLPGLRADNLQCRLKRLQQEPMFQSLPFEELNWLAGVSRTQNLGAGEVLLLEGDECRALYIVDSGTIRLSKGSSSCASGFGREQTIRLMVAGDSFNEVPVFDDGPNPVTAEAVEASRVIVLPKQEVQDLFRRSPDFARVMISIMAGRVRHMLAMIEDVTMRDVAGRVAKILLQIQQPADGVGAGLTVGRRITQREIAEMAGTAREVVARALKKIERSGAIAIKRGDVSIIDKVLLESFT